MTLHLGRRACLLLYYALARFLPGTEFPLGPVWRAARAACVRGFVHSAGARIGVEPRVYLADGRYVSLGDDCVINAGSLVFGAKIGNDVMIGPDVLILCRNHEFHALDRPMRLQGAGDVHLPVIEDDVWLGARVIVLPGQRIGRGAIVAAGAVVSRDVEPFSIVAGSPIRIIGSRLDGATPIDLDLDLGSAGC